MYIVIGVDEDVGVGGGTGGGTGHPQARNLRCGGIGPPQTDIL